VDPINYRNQVAPLYRKHGWEYALTDEYAKKTGAELLKLLGKKATRS
jgi:hypothetical protein